MSRGLTAGSSRDLHAERHTDQRFSGVDLSKHRYTNRSSFSRLRNHPRANDINARDLLSAKRWPVACRQQQWFLTRSLFCPSSFPMRNRSRIPQKRVYYLAHTLASRMSKEIFARLKHRACLGATSTVVLQYRRAIY